MEYYNLLGSLPNNFESKTCFKALLILEQPTDLDFQKLLSNWLCENGCRYAMAWGESCSSWDDSIDQANCEQFNFKEIPDDHFVITTWHDNDTLEEVLFFAKHSAQHPSLALERIVIFHIGSISTRLDLERKFDAA